MGIQTVTTVRHYAVEGVAAAVVVVVTAMGWQPVGDMLTQAVVLLGVSQLRPHPAKVEIVDDPVDVEALEAEFDAIVPKMSDWA